VLDFLDGKRKQAYHTLDVLFALAEGGNLMIPMIIVVDEGVTWPHPAEFVPEDVPQSARIESYDVHRHWSRIGYFLKTEDGHLIVDGAGIRSHGVITKVYWYLLNNRIWDAEAFAAFDATIAHGGIWPPVLILMSSRTYPAHIQPDELREVIDRFSPTGELAFRTMEILFDFGGLSERVEREVRRIATE
jgi:hypothetical protein